MSSDRTPSLRRRRRLALAVLVLAAFALSGLLACGKKGEPLPPLRAIPKRIEDLAVGQQGRILVLDMGYPSTTVSGLALGGLDAVEVYELVLPAAADGSAPPVEANELKSRATLLVTLSGADLASAVTGDRLEVKLPLADPLPEPAAAHVYGVVTVKGVERSDFSNRAGLVPVEPPPAPSDLTLTALADGVELSWTAEGTPAGFDVFRRLASDRGYGAALQRVPGDRRRFLDTSARYGERYIYTVRQVVREAPPLHTAEAGEREVDYQDRFAPPLPASFVGLAERESVRLRWDASTAEDVAGYVVYRKEPGRDFHRLQPELVTGLELLDRGLVTGFTYEYRLQVVDRSGNESVLSEPVAVTLR